MFLPPTLTTFRVDFPHFSSLSEPILMVLLSPVAGKLADSVGSRLIASSGIVIMGASFLLLFLLVHETRGGTMILLGMICVGLGLFSAPNTNSVMGSIRGEDSGIASWFLGRMRFTGQIMSIVVATMVLSLYMPTSLTIEMFSETKVTITTLFYDSFWIVRRDCVLDPTLTFLRNPSSPPVLHR